MPSFTPSYIDSYQSGRLSQKIEKAHQLLGQCTVCPRKCGADRINNEIGFCRTGKHALVCSYHAHFGEEAPLVGKKGSGTIFFSYCNLLCCFCQNFEISHQGEGTVVSPVMEFIMNEISPDTYVNIMPQYYPCGSADKIPGLNRRITEQEFRSAMEDARQAGIRRFDQRRRIFEVW